MRAAALLFACGTSLLLASGAQGDSVGDCKPDAATQCALVCADCQSTVCGNANPNLVDCGSPVMPGQTATDIAWATPGSCFKFSPELFNQNTGCEGMNKYIMEAAPFACLIMAICAVLFCIVWPWARTCCNCCGGETVNTSSFCHGQEDAPCCCPCCEEPSEAERVSGAKYFEPCCGSEDNCCINMMNPYHPCGARYLYPAILLAASIIAMGICISASKDVAETVDNVLDAGINSIDLTLRGNLNVATTQLAVAKTNCTICLDGSGTCNVVDSILVELDRIIKRAQDTMVDLKGKPGTNGVKYWITTFGYILGVISISGSALALIFGLCQCSRLSGFCGCEGCCGGCFIWVALQLVLTILVVVSILLAVIATFAAASNDLCDEIDNLKASPPVITGLLGARYIAEACFYTEMQAAMTLLPSKNAVRSCPQFVEAIDVLKGDPRRNNGNARGGMYEGIASCPRLLNNIGESFSKSCGSLKDGLHGMEAALAMEAAVLIGCICIYWIGYKRWVSEEHVIMPKSPEGPYDHEQAKEMEPVEKEE